VVSGDGRGPVLPPNPAQEAADGRSRPVAGGTGDRPGRRCRLGAEPGPPELQDRHLLQERGPALRGLAVQARPAGGGRLLLRLPPGPPGLRGRPPGR
jgi:hypothetical protein